MAHLQASLQQFSRMRLRPAPSLRGTLAVPVVHPLTHLFSSVVPCFAVDLFRRPSPPLFLTVHVTTDFMWRAPVSLSFHLIRQASFVGIAFLPYFPCHAPLLLPHIFKITELGSSSNVSRLSSPFSSILALHCYSPSLSSLTHDRPGILHTIAFKSLRFVVVQCHLFWPSQIHLIVVTGEHFPAS